MTLIHILVFAVSALLAGWLASAHLRGAFLLSGSLVALYWLQPSTPIRNLDFWLPTASILLTVLVWAWTCAARARPSLSEWGPSAALILAPVLIIALSRYTGTFCCLTPTRPPDLPAVLLAVFRRVVFLPPLPPSFPPPRGPSRPHPASSPSVVLHLQHC